MRRATQSITVAANTTSAPINIPTPDDNVLRTLRNIWVAPQAAGAFIVTVLRTGFVLEVFDSARCAAGNWPVNIDEQFPATLQIQVQIQNTTGGSLTSTVTAAYDVGVTPGSTAAPPSPLV